MNFFLGLITRCKDEFFIKEFCLYYLSQGVDKIYILDDNSIDKSIYNDISNNPDIIISYQKNMVYRNYKNQMEKVNEVYNQIKNDFKWIISVDVDEFITTKKNLNKTIKQELETTFKDYDCIKIPWVMFGSGGQKKNPKSILESNIYRWNHDIEHPYPMKFAKFKCRYNKIEVKCIFKTNKFEIIHVHTPKKPLERVNIINSINLSRSNLTPFYNNLREEDIKNAYLVCHHYRIISEENSINKVKQSNLYRRLKITLNHLNLFDYSEIKDETLKNKINFNI